MLAARHDELEHQLRNLETEIHDLSSKVLMDERKMEDCYPDPGFWEQSQEVLQKTAPWNGGEFRAARDALFVAAVRLHRAFVIAGVKHSNRL